MKYAIRIGCLGLLACVIAGVFYFAREVSAAKLHLDREYAAIHVIDATNAYIEKHPGTWPGKWSDLRLKTDMSSRVSMRFDLTTEELSQKDAVYNAIRPAHGKFTTHPGYKEHLERLWQTVSAKAEPQSERR